MVKWMLLKWSIEELSRIEGWLTQTEAQILQELAVEQQKYSKLDLLEIGSWKGKSGIAIASVLQGDRRLWMIDHFRGSPEQQYPKKKIPSGKYSRNGRPWAFPELLENVAKYQMQNKVIILPLSSQRAAQVVKEQFCFIFIDGDHSYKGVSADWDFWFPHLEKNGTVIFHDALHPSIQKFCNGLKINKNLEIKLDEGMIAFRKLW